MSDKKCCENCGADCPWHRRKYTVVCNDWRPILPALKKFCRLENKQKETDKIPSYTYKVYSRKDMEKIAQFAKANRLRMIREGIDFPGKNLIIKMRSKRKGERK